MSSRKFIALLLIYFASLSVTVAQNSKAAIPKEVIKKVLFETHLVEFLHYDLPERKILYLKSESLLNFKSIHDPRLKIIVLEPEDSSASPNIIEIKSWKLQNGVYKLSLNYDIEGVVSWFKFLKQNSKWKLIDSSIAET